MKQPVGTVVASPSVRLGEPRAPRRHGRADHQQRLGRQLQRQGDGVGPPAETRPQLVAGQYHGLHEEKGQPACGARADDPQAEAKGPPVGEPRAPAETGRPGRIDGRTGRSH